MPISEERLPLPLQVTVRGEVPMHTREYVVAKLERAIQAAGGPVLHVHLVLDPGPAGAAQPHAHIEVDVDVDGSPVHGHMSAPTVTQAADLLEDRLRERLVRAGERRVPRQPHRA